MGKTVIVSASYRTDIPAYYGRWFMNRLAAGFVRVVNPYGGPPSRVALDRDSVDGFVFWTRNPAPFLTALREIKAQGYPFLVQFTLTAYPRGLEPSRPEEARAVTLFRELAQAFGPRAVVWRYDPIVLGPETPADWHRAHFASLAGALRGAADEVVVSFTQYYRKTRRAMAAAGLGWDDPPAEPKRALLHDLQAIAAQAGFRLTLCTQPELAGPGLPAARCIDADRLSDVAGRPIRAKRQGNRPGCDCAQSRDIGAYDTCPMGCRFCYAVGDSARAARLCAEQDERAEYLGPAPGGPTAPGAL